MNKIKNNLPIILIGLITGLANGLFGSGGGTIVVPSMEKFLKLEEHKAHATAIAIILPLSVISLIIYAWESSILFSVALITSIGGVIGGTIGAKLLGKISSVWLHRIFGIFMLVAAVRLVIS
ncbi:MAG: sulfite exporter TauE/SafE family protein [Bacillota bacterium]